MGGGKRKRRERRKGRRRRRKGRRKVRPDEQCLLLHLGLTSLEKVVLFPFCGTKDIDTSRIPNW